VYLGGIRDAWKKYDTSTGEGVEEKSDGNDGGEERLPQDLLDAFSNVCQDPGVEEVMGAMTTLNLGIGVGQKGCKCKLVKGRACGGKACGCKKSGHACHGACACAVRSDGKRENVAQ
jgi:hypothetical protein